VTDFRFTDFEKRAAFVRFMGQTQAYLLDALTTEGSNTQDAECQFKAIVKEAVAANAQPAVAGGVTTVIGK
jgi:hypothetical protein